MKKIGKDMELSIPLMAFTFFYAIALYLLMLGFHFWHRHIDYKNED